MVRLQEYGSMFMRSVARLFQLSGIPSYTLGSVVTPTLDVERMTWEPVVMGILAAVGGTGWVDVWTVPKGERWRLKDYQLTVSSGTFTFNGIGVTDGVYTVPIDQQAAAAVLWSDLAEQPILESGMRLQAAIAAFTGAGNLAAYLLIERQRVIG